MRHTRGYDLSNVQGDIVLKEVFLAEFPSTVGFFDTQGADKLHPYCSYVLEQAIGEQREFDSMNLGLRKRVRIIFWLAGGNGQAQDDSCAVLCLWAGNGLNSQDASGFTSF